MIQNELIIECCVVIKIANQVWIMLANKTIVVAGVANAKSIAWNIAKVR